jgi:hypothetical protein
MEKPNVSKAELLQRMRGYASGPSERAKFDADRAELDNIITAFWHRGNRIAARQGASGRRRCGHQATRGVHRTPAGDDQGCTGVRVSLASARADGPCNRPDPRREGAYRVLLPASQQVRILSRIFRPAKTTGGMRQKLGADSQPPGFLPCL